MEKFFTILLDTLKRKPEMIVMIVMVFGFLFYMHTETQDRRLEVQAQAGLQEERDILAAKLQEARDIRAEKVQDARDAKNNALIGLRIKSCHDIQERGIEAMQAVAGALREQSKSDTELRATVSQLVAATNNNTDSIDDFRDVISGFSALIRQHVYRTSLMPTSSQ